MKIVHYNKGFTLVEMIVSLGIFTIVALVAVTALLKIMDANKKAIALKTSINNMNFTLESMSREMRVGKNYQCNQNFQIVSATNNDLVLNGTDSDCQTSNNEDWQIAFNSSKKGTFGATGSCNLVYAYWYKASTASSPATLKKAQQNNDGCGVDLVSTDFQDLISSEVNILDSRVVVKKYFDNDVNQPIQPYATFFFKGVSGVKDKEKSEFSMQTSVSQRLPK